jgi:anaerobic ribonucleoside-triphosphate reductase
MNSTKFNSAMETDTEKRTKCLVYTRVMGYHRPVESFNIGKKGEHKQRIYFREQPPQEVNL